MFSLFSKSALFFSSLLGLVVQSQAPWVEGPLDLASPPTEIVVPTAGSARNLMAEVSTGCLDVRILRSYVVIESQEEEEATWLDMEEFVHFDLRAGSAPTLGASTYGASNLPYLFSFFSQNNSFKITAVKENFGTHLIVLRGNNSCGTAEALLNMTLIKKMSIKEAKALHQELEKACKSNYLLDFIFPAVSILGGTFVALFGFFRNRKMQKALSLENKMGVELETT